MKEIKAKKCKVCESEFYPRNSLQKVCSFACSVKYAKIAEAKKAKKKGLDELKTLSDYLKLAQTVFNTFIRMRDKNDPCISCGTEKSNLYDSGHYRSVGSNPQLRFNEFNVNKQCRKCNGYWGGNPIEYRKGLIKKYGIEIVEQLESDNEPKKYNIESIKDLIKEYRLKIKLLKIDKSIDF
jgi:hypothetical protein